MNHIKVIQSGVNVERIKSVLDQNPLLWQLHTFRQDFPALPTRIPRRSTYAARSW